MNTNGIRLHEMLERVNAFGSAHARDFPPEQSAIRCSRPSAAVCGTSSARRPRTLQSVAEGGRVERGPERPCGSCSPPFAELRGR
jgi:hypothetical protein